VDDVEIRDGGKSAPKRFGTYELLELMGRSGGALVYRARQLTVARLVTITVLPKKEAAKPALLIRFQRQVAAASKLRHPNILSAIDAGAIGGNQFIVAEHVQGRRLATALDANEYFPTRVCTSVALDIARALEHLEQVGFLHRNLTPRSILLADTGEAKLRGFSMARERRPSGSETWFDRDAYSQQYKAPDLMSDEPIDIRADIYSLGCVLFHMLAGRPPFPGSNAPVVVERHAIEELPDIHQFRERVPEGLGHVLAKALVKERERRYENPSLLVADLEAVTKDRPVEPLKSPPSRGFLGGLRKRKR
jgi:serine/threonine-protein kinase